MRLRGTKGREDLFRLRIGDYQVIYAVDAKVVYMTDIFHKGVPATALKVTSNIPDFPKVI